MLKLNKIFILSLGAVVASSSISSAAFSEDGEIGLKLRATSLTLDTAALPFISWGVGIEQRVTPKMSLSEDQQTTGHASISLDYTYRAVGSRNTNAYAAMANYVINHKKAYFSVGGGVALRPAYSRETIAANYCLQAAVGYNFQDTKGLGIELRGMQSPNRGFNGVGLGLTWRF